ncbi:CHRD domain-containing protein [Enterovibrio coralii]|nr:CHRD domain-containing protein [Enterovibrio coralii]
MKNIVVALAVLMLSACGFDATKTYRLTLSGDQAVPLNDSEQTTKARVQIDEKRKKLRARLYVDNIEGFKFAHIHSGGIGDTGDVLFTFERPKKKFWKPNRKKYLVVRANHLSYSELEAVKNGDWYINVHTDAVPSGELRAQIVPKSTTILSFKADGRQEVPTVETEARGKGTYLTMLKTTR